MTKTARAINGTITVSFVRNMPIFFVLAELVKVLDFLAK
jgi:hypothetical protein